MKIISVKEMKTGDGLVIRLGTEDNLNGIYWRYVVHVWKNSLKMLPFRTAIEFSGVSWNKIKHTLRRYDDWQWFGRGFIKDMNKCFEIYDNRKEK